MNTAPIISKVWSFCTTLRALIRTMVECVRPEESGKTIADFDNLPEPDELAEEIIENLEAGLSSFREVLGALGKTG
jgi:hypothetical protein